MEKLDNKLFDLKRISYLQQLFGEDYSNLIDKFYNQAADFLRLSRLAAAKNDTVSFYKCVHKLRSSSLELGLVGISLYLNKIERNEYSSLSILEIISNLESMLNQSCCSLRELYLKS